MKGITTTINGSAISLNLYPATVTPTQPSRQVSVGQFPANNPNFSRILQISDEFVFVKYGTYAVGIPLTTIVALALTQEPGLTWTPPVILTQPENTSTTVGNPTTFTVEAGSEYTMTYQWEYSADNDTWAALTDTGAYSNVTTAEMTVQPTDLTLNGYYYRCVVTDNATSPGSVTSNAAILTVTA